MNMENTKAYINELLSQFMEGQTTEAEELWLTEYFCKEKEIPAAWEAYAELFRSFKTGAYDSNEEDLEALLEKNLQKQIVLRRLWPWIAAACITVFVGLFMVKDWVTEKAETSVLSQEIKTDEPDFTMGELLETLHALALTGGEEIRDIKADNQDDEIVIHATFTNGETTQFIVTTSEDGSPILLNMDLLK